MTVNKNIHLRISLIRTDFAPDMAAASTLDTRIRTWLKTAVADQQVALGVELEKAGLSNAGRGQVWVSRYVNGDSVTATEVRTVLQRWHTVDGAGVYAHQRDPVTKQSRRALVRRRPLSESGCNHRRTALMHFYTVLNGKSGYNPVREVPKFREPDPEARGVPFATLRKVFAALNDNKTKARILVLALTGLPPSTLNRMTADAVNYDQGTMTVPRRRKGRGTKTRTLPLSTEAAAAFKLLDRYDGWGAFSRDALRHGLHRACARAKVPVIRLYDLRHSFGTAVYQASGDIRAVQALLDHSTMKLTERYTLGAVDERMRAALTATRKVTGKVTGKKKRASLA